MRQKPRLCLEDALALINVFSSVPRGVKEDPMRRIVDCVTASVSSVETSEEDCETGEAEPIYRHVNYAQTLNVNVVEKERFSFIAETNLPTDKGSFRVRAYRDNITGAEPLALISGSIEGKSRVLCRVHDQCVTSEVFGSLKCDCKQQLDFAMAKIKENEGIVFYLPQEGRGIGIANKIAAYALQEGGMDTVDANRHLGLPDDAREYDCVKFMLDDLEISSVDLLTNNPRKLERLDSLGVKVSSRVECICDPNSEHSLRYIKAKAERMGHLIDEKHLQPTV